MASAPARFNAPAPCANACSLPEASRTGSDEYCNSALAALVRQQRIARMTFDRTALPVDPRKSSANIDRRRVVSEQHLEFQM
jgi:hypothetical protein